MNASDVLGYTLQIPRPTALRECITEARLEAERVGMDPQTADEWISVTVLARFSPTLDYTCPSECVERNHPGREHHDWLNDATEARRGAARLTQEDQ